VSKKDRLYSLAQRRLQEFANVYAGKKRMNSNANAKLRIKNCKRQLRAKKRLGDYKKINIKIKRAAAREEVARKKAVKVAEREVT